MPTGKEAIREVIWEECYAFCSANEVEEFLKKLMPVIHEHYQPRKNNKQPKQEG